MAFSTLFTVHLFINCCMELLHYIPYVFGLWLVEVGSSHNGFVTVKIVMSWLPIFSYEQKANLACYNYPCERLLLYALYIKRSHYIHHIIFIERLYSCCIICNSIEGKLLYKILDPHYRLNNNINAMTWRVKSNYSYLKPYDISLQPFCFSSI